MKEIGADALAAPRNADATDRKFVTALARGLDILGVFENERALGNQDIAERTGLPRATVTRLTYTLTALGYLRHNRSTGKYETGGAFLGLSAAIQRNVGIQRTARPYMNELSLQSNTTLMMGMRDRLNMVCLEVIRPARQGLPIRTDAGSTVPLEATALGMAALVAAPLAERTALLNQLRVQYGASWSPVRETVERAYQDFRKRGFVVSLHSWSRQVNAVGVALILPSVPTVYSFACAGPSRSLSKERLVHELGPRLLSMVTAILADWERNPPVRLARPESR